MASRGFSVTIQAVDQASAQFAKINKAMERIQAPVRQLQASLQRFASASGLSRVAKSMGDLGRSAYGAFQSLTRIIAPLSAITSAASAAGLYRMVSAWGQFGSQLRFSAQRIGITSDQLQSLQGAAQLAGSSSGALTSGLTNLQDVMTDAIGGRNPQALIYLRMLHINFQQTATSAKSVTAVLPQIADRIKALKNPTLQARVATELLGGAAEELLPFLRDGSDGMARYNKMARDFGVVNDKGTEGARALAQSQTEVELAVTGLGNSIAQVVAPVLVPMIHHLAVWIASNRQIVASKVAEYVKQFGAWLGSIDWQKVETGITGFGQGVGHVVKLFGGWQTTAEGLLAYMAGRWALGILAPIARVAAALTRVVLLTSAAGGGALAKYARAVIGKGLTGAALDAAALPLFGAAVGFDIGRTPIGSNDTLIRPAGDPDIEKRVRAEAVRQGLDPNAAVALARVESGSRQFGKDGSLITSSAGALGVMQVEPGTAPGVDLTDTGQNISAGLGYYRALLAQFNGNRDAAEAAYNAGPNNAGVRRFAATGDPSALPSETLRYVSSVDATRGQLAYRPGAPIQPQTKVQVELTHANKPPPGFKARIKGGVLATSPLTDLDSRTSHGDYSHGY